MSAYLELRANGTFGPQGAALLYRTVAAVVRFDRIPQPAGEDKKVWLTELAHDFLTDDRAEQRITSLYLRSSDDASLARLLESAVRCWLRDRARRSDVGPLRRRMADVLTAMDDIEDQPTPAGPAWALTEHSNAAVWGGRVQELAAAAWHAPDVRILRWRSNSRRDPVADRDSWERFFRAVLATAQAPVLMSDLVDVACDRFALAAPPTVVALDDEPGPMAAASIDASAEAEALSGIRAGQVWDELTTRERLLIDVHHRPVREIAQILDLGKSAAAVAVRQLHQRLALLVGGDSNGEEVWHRLQELASSDRTPPGDASL